MLHPTLNALVERNLLICVGPLVAEAAGLAGPHTSPCAPSKRWMTPTRAAGFGCSRPAATPRAATQVLDTCKELSAPSLVCSLAVSEAQRNDHGGRDRPVGRRDAGHGDHVLFGDAGPCAPGYSDAVSTRLARAQPDWRQTLLDAKHQDAAASCDTPLRAQTLAAWARAAAARD